MGNPYQRWTAKERDKSARITKMMIEAGQIPPAIVCVLCGQTEGIIEYHNTNYDDPAKYLLPLCYRCHMIHHSYHINPEKCVQYWIEIGRGIKFEPLRTRNYFLVCKEAGIDLINYRKANFSRIKV
jgi:hypothetical protein